MKICDFSRYIRPFFKALEILWNLLEDGGDVRTAGDRSKRGPNEGASKVTKSDTNERKDTTDLALQAADQLDNEESITRLLRAFSHQINEVLFYATISTTDSHPRTTRALWFGTT